MLQTLKFKSYLGGDSKGMKTEEWQRGVEVMRNESSVYYYSILKKFTGFVKNITVS